MTARRQPSRRRRWSWTLCLLLVASVAGCDARLPDPESPGARLYAERCRGCHRLYAPSSMTAEMWRIHVQRMHGDMVRHGIAPLTPAESAVLLDYLSEHSA